MINKVNLCGHVGQDPTIKQVGDTKVAQFSLATSKSWKDKKTGEKKKETQWHNIVVWGAQAEVCEKYVRKGNLIQVFGELNYRAYEDKEELNETSPTSGCKNYSSCHPEPRASKPLLLPCRTTCQGKKAITFLFDQLNRHGHEK